MPFSIPLPNPITVVVGAPVDIPYSPTRAMYTTENSTTNSACVGTTNSTCVGSTGGSVEEYEPSSNEIESYLETFILALEKLYNDNRDKYGMSNVRLVVC